MTPGETMAKMQDVVNKLIKFEKLVDENKTMKEVSMPRNA
jgi:arginine/lysine/ornithine decarboxylase